MKTIKLLPIILLILFLSGCFLPTFPTVSNDGELVIHYIDVGQADSALIICNGEAMLIDGGNTDDGELVCNYLEEQGIQHLEYVVGTHAHEDHIGGLFDVLSDYSFDTVLCSVAEYTTSAFNRFVDAADQYGDGLTVPEHGERFMLGSAQCTILGPISDSDDPNNTSLVIRIDYGDTSFLFTGDAELEEETEILDYGYNVSCTVMKIGHHGSSTSTGYRWLRESAPEYAVISVGQNNDYGHPTETVLSRLRDADVTVYRTDMQGTVVCTSDGTSVSFRVSRNPDADTLSGAGGSFTEDETQAQITYVCNTSSMRFHYITCSSIEDIAGHNRMEFTGTRDDLIDLGYTPCGRCDP